MTTSTSALASQSPPVQTSTGPSQAAVHLKEHAEGDVVRAIGAYESSSTFGAQRSAASAVATADSDWLHEVKTPPPSLLRQILTPTSTRAPEQPTFQNSKLATTASDAPPCSTQKPRTTRFIISGEPLASAGSTEAQTAAGQSSAGPPNGPRVSSLEEGGASGRGASEASAKAVLSRYETGARDSSNGGESAGNRRGTDGKWPGEPGGSNGGRTGTFRRPISAASRVASTFSLVSRKKRRHSRKRDRSLRGGAISHAIGAGALRTMKQLASLLQRVSKQKLNHN
eukprot:GHVT01081153.1.p1 GENE.GHVT01081153.1~~GHVT01081153.1.p1  ORF type:complete len:284 (-),score=30.53 GHVT01081153.1:1588-2439(-)